MDVLYGKGRAERPTEDCGVISANIGGNREKLQFTRREFYARGIRCEGSLTNYLYEGKEVHFCYKISAEKPKLIAAWIREKPDLTTDILDEVYSQSGHVRQVLDDCYVIQGEAMSHTVIVNRDVVFRASSVLTVGDEIRFDARPLDCKHDSGALYQGTCAWIGEEPTLANRFGLNWSKPLDRQDTAEIHNDNHVHGTVVICNETVAIVEVEGFRKRAVLFRRSFTRECTRLQDVVCIGDTVCMIIRSQPKLWFAVKASKTCVALKDESSEASEPSLQKSEILFSDPPLQGVLSLSESLPKYKALISHSKVQLLIKLTDSYIDGKPCPKSDFKLLDRKAVNFEGIPATAVLKTGSERNEPQGISSFHIATCAWIGEKPTLKVVIVTLDPLAEYYLKYKDTTFYGSVVKLYFPDKAIVSVSRLERIACLHASSFVVNDSRPFITDFVKLGDYVSFKLTSDPACELPVRAVDPTVLTESLWQELVTIAAAENPPLYTPVPQLNLLFERAELLSEYPLSSTDVEWLNENG